MKQYIRDCDCEDFPCCVHADLEAGYVPEPEPDEYDLVQCSDYQDLPQSVCLEIDCPHYKECWEDE